MTVDIRALPIDGAVLVNQSEFRDERGRFSRLFCERELVSILKHRTIKQMNFSQTAVIGTVRGFHLQLPPAEEMKLIRCVQGKIWDVVVDLREWSPTFGTWHAEELSASNHKMMVIPEGCAHGFQCLQENTELIYLHTAFYSPELEAGVHVHDPSLAVTWPLQVTGVSYKDSTLPMLSGWRNQDL